MGITKDKFVNEGEGYVGVVTQDPDGKQKPIAVAPGEEVWLSEDEQILTANAPRDPADNPLANGALKLIGSADDARSMRPLRPTVVEETIKETAAAPEPGGEAAVGSRPATEEVATPEAAKSGGRRRSKAAV